ncbi:MAG: hypothetical protein JWN50_667 [Parcubacteria group bacterium]|nr:hypothetical protein [Parcubacteria group bacterium]
MPEFSRHGKTGGTITLRRLALKLYDDPIARARLRENLETLIRLSPLSPEELALATGTPEGIVARAGAGLSIEYADYVKFAIHFKSRIVTLLTEDVATRARR